MDEPPTDIGLDLGPGRDRTVFVIPALDPRDDNWWRDHIQGLFGKGVHVVRGTKLPATD